MNMYIYNTKVIYDKKRLGRMKCGNGMEASFSAPPEFGGYEGFATPEDLFTASIASCLMLTFETVCGKMGIDFQSFECECESMLEEIDGMEMMTKVVIKPVVKGSEIRKLEKALVLAEKYCLVTNSIKSEIVFEPEVKTTEKNK
jgi:organic hydroperoxide reductase OsmC/OhrA